MKNKTFILALGSTGGHIFPILSLAHELRQSGHKIHIISSGSILEKKALRHSDFPVQTLSIGRLRKGVPVLERIQTLLRLPFSIIKAWFIVRKIKPNAALGCGGAVSGPVLLAAWMRGCKVVIWELNAVCGFANKMLVRFAHLIFTHFEELKFNGKKYKNVSIPVRRSILSMNHKKREPDGYFHFLVLGGSLGSRKINQAVLEMYHNEDLAHWKIRHQTGEKDFKSVHCVYAQDDKVECRPFFDNMGECYQWADVIISRAGAGVLSELSACGKACIVIPLAGASDQHQYKNALALYKKNAIEMIEEKNLNGKTLFKTVMEIHGTKKRQLEENIKNLYEPESIKEMVQILSQM